MASENEKNVSYVDRAVFAFNEIMSSSQKDMMENISRVNKGELFVLHFLSMRNDNVLPSELSTALHASTGRISALLGNLEKKGQIEREIDKSNRRNILVTITEAGRNHVETEIGKIKNNMTHVFTDMGESDTAEFIRLIKKFSELMQKHMPRGEDSA